MIEQIKGFDEQRTFGVEVEFTRSTSRERVAAEMELRNINNVSIGHYGHSAPEGFWKLETDGSCGYELISPPLSGYEGLEELKKALESLQDAGADVDNSCGVHVHHDASDFHVSQFKLVIAAYIKFEEAIDKLVPKSRRGDNNTYCESMNKWYYTDYKQAMKKVKKANQISDLSTMFSNRYRKVNMQAYRKHGTIEFRQHSGTLKFEKIKNWILLTQGLINRAFRSENTYITTRGAADLDMLFRVQEIKDMGIKEWYLKRADYLDISWRERRRLTEEEQEYFEGVA